MKRLKMKEDDMEEIISSLRDTYGKTTLFVLDYGAYETLISTVLSQRTKDEVTYAVSERLFEKYDIKRLASAKQNDIEKIIHGVNYHITKAKRIIEISKIILKEHGGKVPLTMEELLTLPGVGRKTANCVIVYGHKRSAIPVDTHVHRISNRLGLVKTKTPEETEQALIKNLPKKYWLVVNDLFVTHGRNICRPISPFCSKCPIFRYCKKISVTSKR